jgi:hypothetical protein
MQSLTESSEVTSSESIVHSGGETGLAARVVPKTVKPRAWKRRAVAAPIPEDAPVTRTV